MKNDEKHYWRNWLAALLATFGIMALMSGVPFFEVPDLIHIELSETRQIFLDHFKVDNAYIFSALLHNTTLDFAFIVAYSLLFHYSARLAMHRFALRQYRLVLFYFLLPGLFDVVENSCIFQMTHLKPGSDFCFDVFHAAVRIKWFIASQGIELSLGILAYGIYQLLRQSPKNQ